jgi:hypothetical protein
MTWLANIQNSKTELLSIMRYTREYIGCSEKQDSGRGKTKLFNVFYGN